MTGFDVSGQTQGTIVPDSHARLPGSCRCKAPVRRRIVALRDGRAALISEKPGNGVILLQRRVSLPIEGKRQGRTGFVGQTRW